MMRSFLGRLARRSSRLLGITPGDDDALRTLLRSGLIDVDYYNRVSGRELESVRHVVEDMLRAEAPEYRDPHWLFCAKYYLRRYPDVAEAGGHPFLHFLRHGEAELRKPHPLFEPEWYVAAQGASREALLNPLRHYVTSSARRGAELHPAFDARWYLEHNRDVAAAGYDPAEHFALHGAREGRLPSSRPGAAALLNEVLRVYHPDGTGPGDAQVTASPADHAPSLRLRADYGADPRAFRDWRSHVLRARAAQSRASRHRGCGR